VATGVAQIARTVRVEMGADEAWKTRVSGDYIVFQPEFPLFLNL
jgi:hypothetical protein